MTLSAVTEPTVTLPTATEPAVSDPTSAAPATAMVRARDIVAADLPAVAELLGRGLGYPTKFYADILDRLTGRAVPPGYPRYGCALESGGVIVGVLLLIFSPTRSCGPDPIRCHVTSWYVEPEFRCFAALFYTKALKYKGVTFINISARKDTLPLLKVQGFSRYSAGQFVAVPLLSLFTRSPAPAATVVAGDQTPPARFEPFERELMLAHAEFGCVTAWCIDAGRAHPFVFHKRMFKGVLPGAQLIYCDDVADMVRFARPLAAFLAARGIVVVLIDANGPIAGLPGTYVDGMQPRYYRGTPPRLGDLAYTQGAMCPYLRPRR